MRSAEAVGATALPVPPANPTEPHGTTTPSPGRQVYCVPTLHPAFALRQDPALLDVIERDLNRAFRIARDGWRYEPHVLTCLPRAGRSLETAVRQAHQFLDRLDLGPQAPPIALDTETTGLDSMRCGLRCLSLAQVGKGEGLAIPWSRQQLGPFFDEVGGRIADIIRGPTPKLFHNSVFDRPVLARYHMPVGGRINDSLIGHHLAEPDLPHDLGFIGHRLLDVDPWKVQFDRASRASQADLQDLLFYCAAEGTPVVLADGSNRLLGDIVRRRLNIEVQSRGPSGQIEARRVVGWHRQRVRGQRWIRILVAGAPQSTKLGLVVTPDHGVFTQRGKVRAEAVCVGDMVPLPEIAWTEQQMSAILGTLLGDSRLIISPARRRRPLSSSMFALLGGHASWSRLTQRKVRLLAPHAQKNKSYPACRKKHRGKWFNASRFDTFSTPMLHQLRVAAGLVYDRRWRRRLRIEALDRMGPIGWAWWFMDNGCRQRGARVPGWTGSRGGREFIKDSVVLSTQRYSRHEVLQAIRWFRQHFGACSAGKDNVIRLSTRATDKFCEAIAPYVFPEVRYKLPTYRSWPPYRKIDTNATQPVMGRVLKAGPYDPPRRTSNQRLRAETRFCLTVEGNHNFFTSFGLISNCGRDSLETARLWPILLDMLAEQEGNQLAVLASETDSVDLAHRMQMEGIPIDTAYQQRISKQLHEFHDRLIGQIRHDLSWPAFSATRLKDRQDLLYGRLNLPVRKWTTGGKLGKGQVQPSTSFKGIVEHAAHPLVAALLRADECRWLLSNVVDKVPGLLGDDGRLHPTWNVAGTDGPRWSSNPNVQNVSERDPGSTTPINVRSIVRASPGHLLVGADFEQLELRYLATLAGARSLLQLFRDGSDVHSFTARDCFGQRFDDLPADSKVRKALRRLAKNVIYAINYGAGVEKVYRTLVEDKRVDLETRALLTQQVVSRIMGSIFQRNPEIPVWRAETLDSANRRSFCQVGPLGRRRHFLTLPVDGPKVWSVEVQQGASEFLVLALHRIDQFRRSGTRILLNGHDSVVLECPERDAEWTKGMVEWAMRGIVTGPAGDLPLTATAKIGMGWDQV